MLDFFHSFRFNSDSKFHLYFHISAIEFLAGEIGSTPSELDQVRHCCSLGITDVALAFTGIHFDAIIIGVSNAIADVFSSLAF